MKRAEVKESKEVKKPQRLTDCLDKQEDREIQSQTERPVESQRLGRRRNLASDIYK